MSDRDRPGTKGGADKAPPSSQQKKQAQRPPRRVAMTDRLRGRIDRQER